jgi:NADP-dependent alcohol dehydrogenase
MNNFVFQNPTRIYFGKGQIAALESAVPSDTPIMLLYGGGSIKQNGVYDQVKEALGTRQVIEFGGVEPNPTYETLMKAVHLAREKGVGFLLSVGGGSVLDGTKFVAAAIPLESEPWDILTGKVKVSEALPLGSVLTLPATGSEMNGASVISRLETGQKLAFVSPHVYPKFSILDPETTYSLPPRQLANGLVDAFVHVIEQYLTYPASAPLQDRLAESVMQTLVEIAPAVLSGEPDYETRATFMWTATMALNGVIGVGVPQDWSTHVIGHELTALYGIDHARTLAAVLPSLMHVQRDVKQEKLLQFAARVWDVRSGSPDQRIDAAIDRTATFFESLGIPSRLSAYEEVSPETPGLLAKRLEARGALPIGERSNMDRGRIERIVKGSLSDALHSGG